MDYVLWVAFVLVTAYIVVNMYPGETYDLIDSVQNWKPMTKQLDDQLVILNNQRKTPLEYFHMDADFITFFYSVRDLRKANPTVFDSCTFACDQILEIRKDIVDLKAMDGCGQHFDSAKDRLFVALNHFQTLIFGIQTEMLDKYRSATDRLHVLLQRQIDIIHAACAKEWKSGPMHNNVHLRYNRPTDPRANDGLYDPHYDLY